MGGKGNSLSAWLEVTLLDRGRVPKSLGVGGWTPSWPRPHPSFLLQTQPHTFISFWGWGGCPHKGLEGGRQGQQPMLSDYPLPSLRASNVDNITATAVPPKSMRLSWYFFLSSSICFFKSVFVCLFVFCLTLVFPSLLFLIIQDLRGRPFLSSYIGRSRGPESSSHLPRATQL